MVAAKAKSQRRARGEILRFDDVLFRIPGSRESAAVAGSMALAADELTMILVSPEQGRTIADACAGIVEPQHGRVEFLGNCWTELSDGAVDSLRARIGRVFSRGNWLANLPMIDNILLPALHHSRRTLESLRDEALQLAVEFALPGIPLGLPHDFAVADLQRAACVRAFLGAPSLVVLEDPTDAIYPDGVQPLVNASRHIRDRGGAILWLTPEEDLWRDLTIPATRRYRLAGRELLEVKPRQ